MEKSFAFYDLYMCVTQHPYFACLERGVNALCLSLLLCKSLYNENVVNIYSVCVLHLEFYDICEGFSSILIIIIDLIIHAENKHR